MFKFTNILYPINLDSKNQNNLSNALEFAIANKSRIHILYVNDEAAGYRHPADHEDAVALKVRQNVSAETLDRAQVVYAVSKGDLGGKIKDYCKSNAIDLIIVSHRHHGKFYSSFFDTPDENIIDSVNVPVLILPEI